MHLAAISLLLVFFAGFIAFIRFCSWVLSRREITS